MIPFINKSSPLSWDLAATRRQFEEKKYGFLLFFRRNGWPLWPLLFHYATSELSHFGGLLVGLSWLESRWEVIKHTIHSIWYASIFMPYWLKNQRGPQYSFRTPKYWHFFNTSTSPSPAQVVECLSVGNCIQYLRIVENVLPSLILLDARGLRMRHQNLQTQKTLAKLQLKIHRWGHDAWHQWFGFLDPWRPLIGSPRARTKKIVSELIPGEFQET